MPASTAKKDLRDAVLKIKDNGANETTVIFGSGNLTYSETYNREYETDRGSLATGSVRDGEDTPVEVNVTARWVDVISDAANGEAVTPYEAMKRKGNASAWVSTGADSCEPYAVELEFTLSPNCTGATTKKDELIVFNEFRVENVTFDTQAGTIVFSGKSKETAPTVTRPV